MISSPSHVERAGATERSSPPLRAFDRGGGAQLCAGHALSAPGGPPTSFPGLHRRVKPTLQGHPVIAFTSCSSLSTPSALIIGSRSSAFCAGDAGSGPGGSQAAAGGKVRPCSGECGRTAQRVQLGSPGGPPQRCTRGGDSFHQAPPPAASAAARAGHLAC